MSEETVPTETNTTAEKDTRDNDQPEHFSDINLNTSLESPFDPPPSQGEQEETREEEPTLEFFGNDQGGGGGSETESNPSPKQEREKEEETISNGFVTLSPPLSPGKPPTDDVDSNLLESLDEDSNSVDYTEIPRPKPSLEVTSKTTYTQQQNTKKMLDFESPIAGPGKDRNVGALMEEVGQDVDLKVDIMERKEKMGSKTDLYVSYKICTDTTRPSHLFEESHYEVCRRYRDFEWLREMLEKNHPTLITPPLPGKQLSRYFDHKSGEFLEERQKALDRFLKRLTVHPYFSFDSSLKIFLTFEDEEFSTHVSETSGSNKLLGVVTSSVKQATTAFMLKNADPFYARESKYFSDVAERFSIVERIGTRIHSEREDLVSAKEDMSSAMIHWAALEPQLERAVRKFGSCIENCTTALKSLNSANAYSVFLTAKEYQLFCASGVSAVRRRDALQLEKERTTDDREKKKKVHDEAAAAGKLQKLPKLADELQKSSVTADKALDDLTKANEELRVDIEKWREAKNRDVTQFMKQFSNNHIDYHQKCFDEWESVLKLLKIPQLTDLELESSNSDSRLSTPTLQRSKTETDNENLEDQNRPRPEGDGSITESEERKKDEENVDTKEGETGDDETVPVVSPAPGLFDNDDQPDTHLFTNQFS